MKLLDDLAQTAMAMRTTLRRGLLSPVAPNAALPLRGSPVLRGELCTRCQACVEACPTGCIRIDGAGTADGTPRLALDWQQCMCCGICSRICPEKAIALSTEVLVVMRALSTREEHRL
jgi:formate hydrogenlyase subunit 6/NADH:ubiquinone oxidoreductase subunit I